MPLPAHTIVQSTVQVTNTGDGTGTRLDPSPTANRNLVTIVNPGDVPLAIQLVSPPSTPTMTVARCEQIDGNFGERDFGVDTNVGIYARYATTTAGAYIVVIEYVPA